MQQHLPLQSSTTPAWDGITDKVVQQMEIIAEEKNNDSGVSPGHYTSDSVSSRSRSSSSTVNCSLSPRSVENFPDSPPKDYKNLYSPVGYEAINTQPSVQQQLGENLAMTLLPNEIKTEKMEVEELPMQPHCPIFPFTSTDRVDYTENLSKVSSSGVCDLSIPMSTDTGNLIQEQSEKEPQPSTSGMNQVESSMSSPNKFQHGNDVNDESDIRKPCINSQGKVKKFRCKQCDYTAITKHDFWDHSRCHIKSDKIMPCPKCNFVTEYKHHLEYHLRNHLGSKPFKCNKCAYSCVNKSMLNSHMKSHSSVYQYRCADCSYATKYCHSLKLHLRKYTHKPAMVLNSDGSPNPLPIIDVYGTRRGPKAKPQTSTSETPFNDMKNEIISSTSSMTIVPPKVSPAEHLQLNSINPIQAFNPVPPAMMEFYNSQIFSAFPMPNHFTTPSQGMMEQQIETLATSFITEYTKSIQERMNIDYNHDGRINEVVSPNASNKNGKGSETASSQGDEDDVNSDNDTLTDSTHIEKEEALDLTISEHLSNDNVNETTSNVELFVNNNNNNNRSDTKNNMENDISSSNAKTKVSGTSRRKGKAVRLNRHIVDDEKDESQVMSFNNRDEAKKEDAKEIIKAVDSEENVSKKAKIEINDEYSCPYCQIAFNDTVLHTIHMGYHGYNDPFTCNMCGEQCNGKVSFFIHIARSKHA